LLSYRSQESGPLAVCIDYVLIGLVKSNVCNLVAYCVFEPLAIQNGTENICLVFEFDAKP